MSGNTCDLEALQTLPRFHEGYASVNGVRLHYVSAGAGPLVILLHGFPDFWYGWRYQFKPLVDAGFRVVAPDLRGYNLSDKPGDVASYHADTLAADVRDLIHVLGETSAHVAGHDWGAGVAWVLAMNHPEVVRKLAILNLPHPRVWLRNLWRPGQLLRSWYMFYFQLPWLPERTYPLLRLGYFNFRKDARPGAFSDQDLAHYAEAHAGLRTRTAMINYYRAALRRGPWDILGSLKVVSAETLVIWGEQDRYISRALSVPSLHDVPRLTEVRYLPKASHWVQQDAPEEVSSALISFFSHSLCGMSRRPATQTR